MEPDDQRIVREIGDPDVTGGRTGLGTKMG